ncbi:MAG: phosphoglycerate kinase [Alphaproteobacteria bacterium]|nr:phosphoglycerate kinase [Alphaproteobacteria bacterium]MBP7759478.1 phosphoglycerate kinase [Alphaproteobacteria bacterium]MBP7762818.1 phosphoglycerate kinase [Alphaproteobacteria bacterium]MBP7904330.1 phosphoglycerate kinase [Alphaproteobacteria bacterium]
MNFPTIRDLDFQGKTVLLRADLNVPRHNSQITDHTRIDRLKPTIDELRRKNAKIVIISHFGRPDGDRNPQMSLAFLAPVLEKRWSCSVSFSPDCLGEQTEQSIARLAAGEVLLLENVRYYKEEEENDRDFAKKLAALGDIFVNDAFSAAHRAHASTSGLAEFLPAVAGLLMEEELKALSSALIAPQRPVMAFTGGSKISTKLKILNNLIPKVDYLVLGGAMANTFLFAQGKDVGKSMCEKNMEAEAKSVLAKATKSGCEIILPFDVVVTQELKENAAYEVVDSQTIPATHSAIDIGPKSIAYVGEKLKLCRTVIWNGPLGVFEIKPFDNGTNAVARMVAERTKSGECISIAGGGDTVAALENAGAADSFSYISTAGGAFLEWLEGHELPGVKALLK